MSRSGNHNSIYLSIIALSVLKSSDQIKNIFQVKLFFIRRPTVGEVIACPVTTALFWTTQTKSLTFCRFYVKKAPVLLVAVVVAQSTANNNPTHPHIHYTGHVNLPLNKQ